MIYAICVITKNPQHLSYQFSHQSHQPMLLHASVIIPICRFSQLSMLNYSSWPSAVHFSYFQNVSHAFQIQFSISQLISIPIFSLIYNLTKSTIAINITEKYQFKDKFISAKARMNRKRIIDKKRQPQAQAPPQPIMDSTSQSRNYHSKKLYEPSCM